MRTHLLALSLGLALTIPALALADAGDGLKVGTCKRDITPISPSLAAAYQTAFGAPGAVNHTDPIYMAGFDNGRAATGYHDRLWARGLVLDNAGKRVAIVAIDAIGYFKNEVDTIRGLVSPSSQVDFVLVSSTHVHEGPDTMGLWGADPLTSGIDYAYLDFINATVANCIDDAAAHLQPALVYYATAHSDGLSIGTDPEDDGFGVGDTKVLAGDALLAPATQGRIVDPNIAVMQLTKRNGSSLDVLATLVNFGSHPESMGSDNTLITSDFPNYVRQRIEARYGGLAIWMSGDLGVLQGPLHIDVLDPITHAAAPRRTFRFAEVHGTQLADRAGEAIDAVRLKKGKPNPSAGAPSPDIAHATVDPVAVPLDNPYFRLFIAIGVIDTRRSVYTNGVPDASVGFPFPPPFDSIPQATGDDLHTEVSALQIGKGAVVVVPDELDPQIGFGYRGQLAGATGAEHTFIAGLGNDEVGYQVPFAKFDNSCLACAPYVIAGFEQFCPIQPIDCNTVFQNNVGQQLDPKISEAFTQAVDNL